MAIRNFVYELFWDESEQSIEVNFEEDVWKKYSPAISEGFELKNQTEDKNLTSRLYFNENAYIKISIFTKEFELSLDNENCTNSSEIIINDCSGRKMIKNDITTIVFPFNNYLFEVVSNLPEQDTINLAKSINDEK